MSFSFGGGSSEENNITVTKRVMGQPDQELEISEETTLGDFVREHNLTGYIISINGSQVDDMSIRMENGAEIVCSAQYKAG